MGRVAAELADRVVVTSDNPRSEAPTAIIADILASGIAPTLVEVDRRAAIRGAIAGSRSGDVVLIAGKGHEDYQIIGAEKAHFSDVEEARAALGVGRE
jgi:UDP-N-acetylmuramoyl-L-alanyl-D-glutamate--2,6-diaminopimelate ligase